MVAKKINVPDIGSLLGQIAEKRDSGELPRTEVQRVQPVDASIRKAGKTAKQEEVKLSKPEARGAGGRPTVKDQSVEYVKLSPRIPKPLKKATEIALINERFHDDEGRTIKTLDEIIAFALERLLKEKE